MSTLAECPPRFATPRTESRPTRGGQAAKYAAALGTPLMPWQRYVLDVALEYNPDTGNPYYRNVVVTVPRQNGKTSLLLVLFLVRALAQANNERQSIVYTSHERGEAKNKLVDDWLPLLEGTQFNNYFTTTQANGNEAIKFNNGSLLKIIAATKKSGHGKVIHLGVVDEAFSLSDARMEQALVPAMRTKRDAQYWVTSTAGTFAESPYLWSKVESGRKLIEDDIRDGTCYFEWSADEDADPSLESTWRSCTPALDITIDIETIRAEYTEAVASGNLSEFLRAALNRWVVAKTDPVISLDRWNELISTKDEAARGNMPWALAIDVAEDRSSASIGAAWKRSDGEYQVEVIETHPGTAWVAQKAADLWHEKRPVGIWLDRNGPVGSLISDMNTLNVPLLNDAPVSDLAKGCGQFFDACKDGTLHHMDDPTLLAALDGAAKRSVADAWVWSRKNSNIDISPLVSITMALYGIKAFSRTPEVYSIEEIMEEKRRAAEAAANDEDVVISITAGDGETQPDPQPQPEQSTVSNVRRVPI